MVCLMCINYKFVKLRKVSYLAVKRNLTVFLKKCVQNFIKLFTDAQLNKVLAGNRWNGLLKAANWKC